MNKRLIFTITSGRSGTGLLGKLLSVNSKLKVKHEAKGFGDFSKFMRPIQRDPKLGYVFWNKYKIPEIIAIKQDIYIETSHLFCKGFLEPLLDIGVIPDLIVLRRNKREVARSLLRLDTIPSRSKKGIKYLLRPSDPGVLKVKFPSHLSDYQLCYWYCLEIEKRQSIYSEAITSVGGKVLCLEFEDLVHNYPLDRLINELDLPHLNPYDYLRFQLMKIRKPRINTKEKTKLDQLQIDYKKEESNLIDLIHA